MMNADKHPVGVLSLSDFCSRHPRVALAFSGGADSSYLLSALLDAKVDVGVYLVQTAFQADFELRDAQQVAQELEVQLHVIELDVLSQKDICSNPPDRCYWCKKFIFGTIIERMKQDGYTELLDGTNASDDPTRRPGFRALAELGVLSPLRLAGITKDEVRRLSAMRGLFTWEKPNFSCLATKVEEGLMITSEGLEAIAQHYQNEPWSKTSRSA